MAGGLLDALWAVPAVDHHAHGILPLEPTLDEFRGMFSESPDPAQWPHVATGLTYRRAMRDLAAFLGCEATEAAVFAHRLGADFDAYSAGLLRASATGLLLIDDGYPPPGEGYGWERMGELAGCPARPVMRIERVAEEALSGSFDDFRERIRAEVAGAGGRGFVGLKTIAAYRSGLDVQPPDLDAARAAFAAAGARIEAKPLLELALWDALEANAPDPLPLQVHCGFGDSDLLLPRADPTWLKPAIERHRETPFVLLHCYPFVREAGWLAHVYGNVFFDLSLTIPHVSRPAEMLRQALELAPVSKLLYASDAARTPELYLLAARWWRIALAEVLAAELPPVEAERAGEMILRDNARAVYPID
ncbi:MAG TPA: amidohydrolase family protein [Gaiellales bacterium]